MVILHDAIKTIRNGVFVFFKKEQKPASFQKNKNIRIKTQVGCFFKKRVFLNPDCLSILCVIFPWSHDLWLSVRRTIKV